MPKHKFVEPKDVSPDNTWGQLNIVDGGLSLCHVCGCLEGGLSTDCPGELISMMKSDEIYAGKIDYRDGEGWVKKLNPTNITWLYGAYVRWNASDIQFAAHQGLSYDYFLEIKQDWLNKGLKLDKIVGRNNG